MFCDIACPLAYAVVEQVWRACRNFKGMLHCILLVPWRTAIVFTLCLCYLFQARFVFSFVYPISLRARRFIREIPGMSHFIVTLPEEDAREWHCDDDCPFIVRTFRRRRLRNCKKCTPNNAIDGDAVYCTPTGKCIHKDQDCHYLRHSTRISAKKCEHCFRESSLA